jgi:hypothetical protein
MIASGRPIGSGFSSGSRFHIADHVVAQEAEQAGRHRRQALGQLHLAFADQDTQGLQRPAVERLEGVRVGAGTAVDLGLVLRAAPDHVGLEADDRVAPAHRAALDRFQQEELGRPSASLR